MRACHRSAGSANPTSRSWATSHAERLSIVSFVVRRPAAATCTTTSSSRCSTTCSASRPAAAARAPARTATDCSASTSSAPTSSSGEIVARLRGHQARLGAGQLQLLHLRGRASSTSSRRSTSSPRTGGRLLTDYRFDPHTGLWRHRDRTGRSRRCGWATCASTPPAGSPTRSTATTAPEWTRSPGISSRPEPCSRPADRGG